MFGGAKSKTPGSTGTIHRRAKIDFPDDNKPTPTRCAGEKGNPSFPRLVGAAPIRRIWIVAICANLLFLRALANLGFRIIRNRFRQSQPKHFNEKIMLTTIKFLLTNVTVLCSSKTCQPGGSANPPRKYRRRTRPATRARHKEDPMRKNADKANARSRYCRIFVESKIGKKVKTLNFLIKVSGI